jgi:hypothetical protein
MNLIYKNDDGMTEITNVMKQVIMGDDDYLRAQFGDSLEEWYHELEGRQAATSSAIYDLVDILENHGIECTADTLYSYLVDIDAIDESDIDPEYKRYQDSECQWVGKYRDENGKYRTVTFLCSDNKVEAEKQFYEELPDYYTDEYLVGRTK